EAKLKVDNRLRSLRRNGEMTSYQSLMALYKNTF
ncbi:MAG: PII-interacting protein PipX family protein, partial [Microcystaceae cyanobacterium]